jgi:hypothetical protein
METDPFREGRGNIHFGRDYLAIAWFEQNVVERDSGASEAIFHRGLPEARLGACHPAQSGLPDDQIAAGRKM